MLAIVEPGPGGEGRILKNIGNDLVKVRHYASALGLKGIRSSGSINASRGFPLGVDVEVAPFLKPSQVNLGQTGRGSYIEFILPRGSLSKPQGFLGGQGNPGRIVTGGAPFRIQNASQDLLSGLVPF